MANYSLIQKKKIEYEHNQKLLYNVIQACQNNITDELCMSNGAPENEHQEEIDRNLGETISQQYGCFDPGRNSPASV